MSGTVKTLLIVGGAGAGLFVLYRLTLAPQRPTTARAAAPQSNISQLATQFGPAVASSLKSLFSSGSSVFSGGSGSGPIGSSYVTSGSLDTSAQADYAISHGVLDEQGNELIDLNTGNAVVYGTD